MEVIHMESNQSTPDTAAEAQTPAAEQPSATVIRCRLTRDPELRYATKNGKAFSRLRVAINGEKPEDTRFMDVVCFGKTAEAVCKFLKKGYLIEASSSRSPVERTWVGRDGNQRSTTELLARRIDFDPERRRTRSAAPVAEQQVA